MAAIPSPLKSNTETLCDLMAPLARNVTASRTPSERTTNFAAFASAVSSWVVLDEVSKLRADLAAVRADLAARG